MAEQQLTIDQFISQLRAARKEVGGDAPVRVCVPYSDGIGWRYAKVINAHVYDNGVDVPVTSEADERYGTTSPAPPP